MSVTTVVLNRYTRNIGVQYRGVVVISSFTVNARTLDRNTHARAHTQINKHVRVRAFSSKQAHTNTNTFAQSLISMHVQRYVWK